jgi:hypothetical protein
VRLPLSPNRIVSDDKDTALEQLRCDIVSLLNEDLTVIIDLHAQGKFQKDLEQNTGEAPAHLEDLWRRLQPVLVDLPPNRVLLGLYNEPQIDADAWWAIQSQMVRDLRAIFPLHTFVATAGPDGGPWNLERMTPYDDKNILYDFHFYQPMIFTHHGADWLPSYKPEDKTTPIFYPANSDVLSGTTDPEMINYIKYGWNRERLSAFINKIARWGKRNGVKIACLEFGVYRPYADTQSRAKWLNDIRKLLEAKNIPWAMWEYRGNFGLIDRDGNADPGVAEALGLNHNSAL